MTDKTITLSRELVLENIAYLRGMGGTYDEKSSLAAKFEAALLAEQPQALREQFDTWADENGYDISRNEHGDYAGIVEDSMWTGWQAKAALADPVPPAGVEPGVVIRQYRVVRPDPRDTPYSAWFEIESAEKDEQISASLRFTEGRGEPAVYEVRELVDRAHVTRLHAEVERLTGDLQEVARQHGLMLGEFIEERDALQSELTKARELLAKAHGFTNDVAHDPDVWLEIEGFLSNQSAPADKGQGDPVAWQFYQDGKWWNGDDRIKDHRKNTIDAGYEVRDLYAEQPTPVAVVMPLALGLNDGPYYSNTQASELGYLAGWKACLDELARLNGVKP